MRLKFSRKILVASSFLVIGPAMVFAAFAFDLLRREVVRTTEKSVDVKLEAAFGNVILSKGDPDKIVVAEYWRTETEKQKLHLYYDVRGERGKLQIEIKETSRHGSKNQVSVWKEMKGEHGDLEDRQWNLQFSDAIPMSYDIELGAGKGDFDFTGLKVRDLKLSSGASAVEFRMDEPNEVECDDVTIESGVSKFTGSNLSNLNFQKLKFSGGVGAYKLDFGGELQRSASVDVEVGLGAVTLYVPREIPARIISDESWFSSLDVDDAFERTRKKSVYETADFSTSRKTLTIRVESGLGSVRVRSR